jgi:hypothetical protein
MTSAAFAHAAARDSLSYQDALLDVVGRARDGDAQALAYVFDHVFCDVYHHVFLVTRDRKQAERATRRALDPLPAMLRGNEYPTLTALRDALVYQASLETRPAHDAVTPARELEGMRAVVRHVVLMAATSVTAISAVFLAVIK